MKTIIALIAVSLLACSSAFEEGTPNCDKALGEGWGQHLGTEVESSSNLDSEKCAQFGETWCCAL